jgi:hypothetical protein
MHRTCHPRGQISARAASLLLSVLAVLALACFPGLAQAEEATAPQYTPEVPTVPNEEGSAKKGGGLGSNDGGGQAGASESPGGGGTGGNDDPGSAGGTNSGQGNQASGKNGTGKTAGGGAAAGKISEQEKLALQSAPTATVDDDSSSPLVPILIAVAILAAISIGAFYYRQRRQDPDSPVSPKAS